MRFYELTNSAEDTPKNDLDTFLSSIKDMEMEEAYQQVSFRVSRDILSLSKRQRKDAMEYSDYIGTRNLPAFEKERQQKKIKDSLDIKISRNMSGYSLANALFNCVSPKRTPYRALEVFMRQRAKNRG